MMIFPCPLHWLMHSQSTFHDRLIAASLQFLIQTIHAWAQWTMSSSETPSIFMSDSSVEERPPPDRPAGPPPPIPVQAQQDLAHQVSSAVADTIGFQGSILCYLPWDLRHLKCLVLSVRAMRPHERSHPNVLEIQDAPSAEEAEHAEGEEEEGHHADNHEHVTEASMEAGMEPTNGIEASSAGHRETEGDPESLVNRTIRRMEAEGRSVMTPAEIAAIQADFDAASEDENTVTFDHLFGGKSHADGGTGGGEDDTGEAHHATDTRATSSGSAPQAKPRAIGQKKCGTHLSSPHVPIPQLRGSMGRKLTMAVAANLDQQYVVGKWQTVDETDEAINLANDHLSLVQHSLYQRMANFDAEMDEFFGPVKDEGTPNENQDPNKISPFALSFGPNKRRRNPFEERTHHPVHPTAHHRGTRDPLVFNLAKTVIKQQEELRVLRQDTALILFFMPGRDTVLNHLYTTAFRFKAKQAEEPTWTLGQQPMRMVLAMALFKELVDRLNSTISSQEKLKRVTDQGWRDSTGWRYQVWNRSTKQLEADPQRAPIPDDKLLDHLATVLQCLKHPILTRFACTRRMAETMTSQATFKMDVALRSHSALTFWDEMQVLRGNSVFQLVGMGYKTESLGRGPAEQKLLDMMYGRK
ncbi:unnamed protein product [Symbiodinium necroappetens]|uniref:Uncharacterized protein n=1 Tax=Symbiodinium necroappetens TaxID=1628268 RepID=A0A812U493_9DINO|nr:unnamed protein product [Symbiodinium necroappetens]